MPTMIHSIQYLRALAALLVVFRHVYKGFGQEGVDIFFIISGYIMMHIMYTSPRSSLDFFLARFLRIAPTYYAATVVAVIAGLIPLRLVTSESVLTSVTFWIADQKKPLLFVGWSLEYEFLFYALCAFCLFLCRSINDTSKAIIISLLGLFIVQDIILFPSYLRGFYIEFLYGIVIYFLINRSAIPQKTPIWLHLIIGCVAMHSMVYFFQHVTLGFKWHARFFWVGLPAAVFCYSVIALEQHLPKIKILHSLAEISYSLYLTHMIAILLAYNLVKDWPSHLHQPIQVLASIALAIFFYRLVERPLRDKLTADRVSSWLHLENTKRIPTSIKRRLLRVNPKV